MFPFFNQPANKTQPSDDKDFRRKLIDSTTFAVLLLTKVAEYNHWIDLAEGADDVKWLLELVRLLL